MRRAQKMLAWLAFGAASLSAAAHADERALQLRAAFGVGAHSRSFVRSGETMPNAYVPAIEGSLGLVIKPAADFSLAISASYQTGLWLTVTELPPFALANEVSVRSQRLALNIAPSWRIGSQTRIGFALGGSIRSFWPEDRALQTPRYNLVGPHVRGELLTAIAGPVRLRVTPELQWLMLIEEDASPGTQGAAVGGELVLELSLGPMRALALCYRESHALLARGASFRDVERYLTVRIEEAF